MLFPGLQMPLFCKVPVGHLNGRIPSIIGLHCRVVYFFVCLGFVASISSIFLRLLSEFLEHVSLNHIVTSFVSLNNFLADIHAFVAKLIRFVIDFAVILDESAALVIRVEVEKSAGRFDTISDVFLRFIVFLGRTVVFFKTMIFISGESNRSFRCV
jgi:hypothetical protein